MLNCTSSTRRFDSSTCCLKVAFVNFNVCVHQVRLTHPFGNAIRHILEVADVTEKLRSARARVSMFDYDTVHPKGPNEKLRKKALEKARELQVKIDDIKRKHHFTQTELSDVCGAFVTFNNEESFQRCLAAYKQHQGMYAPIPFDIIPYWLCLVGDSSSSQNRQRLESDAEIT